MLSALQLSAGLEPRQQNQQGAKSAGTLLSKGITKPKGSVGKSGHGTRGQSRTKGGFGLKADAVQRGLSTTAALPCRITLYDIPPTYEITLEEFEELGLQRVALLKEIDKARYISANNTTSDEFKRSVRTALKSTFGTGESLRPDDLSNTASVELYKKARRDDHIGHYILRLAYCRSEEMRRWFLQQERDLFAFRFEEYHRDVAQFFDDCNMHYTPILESEKMKYAQELTNASFAGLTEAEDTEYFVIPFEEALRLVSMRKVFLRDGNAYVPRKELVSLVSGVFRMRVNEALAATSRALPHIGEEERLEGMLQDLSTMSTKRDFSMDDSQGKVTLAMLDELSELYFPPCMRNLFDTLRKDHHLKHFGRQQLGLFIKGIGLSLDDALKFWRDEFTKKMTEQKFQQGYAYNIRHNYGMEGKRTNYTPMSCNAIIMSNQPGAGDTHGCPFRHFDQSNLRAMLHRHGIDAASAESILLNAKQKHYQLGCSKYFEARYGKQNLVEHPNSFFNDARTVASNSTLEAMED
eukprot:Clim_evm80s153 gene=Clim_evmTU80s153